VNGPTERPKGPAVPPARPTGPGKTPNEMFRPNGPVILLMAHAVRRTVGPLGRTGWWWDCRSRAYDPGWENGWPFGPDDGPFGPGKPRPAQTLHRPPQLPTPRCSAILRPCGSREPRHTLQTSSKTCLQDPPPKPRPRPTPKTSPKTRPPKKSIRLLLFALAFSGG
jgi:hypothetical protein